jgi:hypothetical protein
MRKILFLFSLLILISTTNLFSQLSGTFTVGSGGNYSTISDAVSALNSLGVAAPGVTFNVLAGHTENTTAPITITATGTASAPIVFQKNGAGANPLVTRTDAGTLATSTLGGAGDAIIRLEGTDYITFDRIDVTASQSSIEYGYLTHKPSGTDGCQNVTIKNCTITMNKGTSDYVVGIYIGNGTTFTSSAAGVNVSANSGKNQNITIIGNTITNVHAGIIVRGSSAAGYYDSDVTIGQSGAGNTITNFGGGSATATYGVYFIYVNNPTVAYNTITSATHGSTLYGIFYSTVTGNVVGSNNAFTLANNSSSSATQFIYITNAVTSEVYSNNTFAAGTLSSTGEVSLIYSSNNTPNKTISGNSISGTINRTGSSGDFYCFKNIVHSSSGTAYVQNNNFSNITLAGTSTFYGIYYAASVSQAKYISGNTISNITVGSGSVYGILTNYDGSNSAIYNNNVYNLSASGSSAIYGMSIGGSSSSGAFSCYGNTIYHVSNSGTGAVYGLYLNGTTGSTLNAYKNNIYNIYGTNASSIVYGLYVAGGSTVYVYNNFISDLRATVASNANAVSGLYIAGGTTVGAYYNTVYLNASSTGTIFGSSAIYALTTPTLDLRNNIFVNVSTPNGTGLTVAYRRSDATLTTYSSNSNNNDFYAGTPSASRLIFNDGTNSDQTISAFKTRVAPRDAASFTENPHFVNVSTTPYNLHLQTTVATQCESGGSRITSPIAITNDFDGDTRWGETGYTGAGTAVDVGADEFEGIPLDLTPPVITYTALSNTASTSNRVLTNFVTITDPSGVNTTTYKPRLYFKKSTDNNTYVGNTSADNGWKYVVASNASSPFSFTIDYTIINGGSVSTGDVIQYFVVAQDEAPTPNVGINSGTFAATPSSVALTAAAFPIGGTINSYGIVGTISGNKTVGTGGDYLTLTGSGGLFEDINNKVVTGDITATIITDISNEPGTNALNQMVTEGGNWTLTIQPDAATVRNITGSYAGGLIRLNGADSVTIDGRFSGSGNYLSFTNNNNTASAAVIWVNSQSATNPATGVTIRNCIVTGGGSSTLGGIIVSGSSMGGVAEADNTNTKILFNQVRRAQYGIALVGNSTGQTNSEVLNNNVGSTTPADKISYIGIFIGNQQDCQVSNNKVIGLSSSAADNLLSGIIILGVSLNSVVNANEIADIKNTNTGGWGATGILLGSSSTNTNLRVSNNVIYDIAGYGFNGNIIYNGIGIRITSGGGYKIAYNSVNLATDQTTAGQSTAILINAGTGHLIRNNVFVNSQTTGTRYSIYSGVANTAFTTINNNNYFSSQHVGFLSSDRTTLSDWRTATGQDANSYSGNPAFTSPTNLQPDASNPDCWNLNGKGVPISGIGTDFAGSSRSTSIANGSTDIGAFEFSTSTTPPAATPSGTPAPSTTTTYSVSGKTVTSIDWGGSGTVPTSVNVQYYSGTPAPNSGTKPRINAYWNITKTGGSGFTYDITLTYDEAQLGSINENNLVPIKSDDGGTTWTPYTTIGTGPGQFQRNTAANTITLYGMTSFSYFTLGDEDDPLPVQLSSFTASTKGRDVILNWTTATEVNTAGFEIERKLVSQEKAQAKWENVGFVRGNGNSNRPVEYTFTDMKLNTGKYAYRLKMVDNDGSYEYSNEVVVEIGKPDVTKIEQNYPNAFNPATKIEYQLANPSKVVIEVYNITGQKLTELVNDEQVEGYYSLVFDASKYGLASGIYFYRMIAMDKVTSKNVVMTKKMLYLK